MAKIKSFTDLQQSKKLTEILPPESADMGWYYSRNPQTARNQMWLGTKVENADIPCWSLVALLGIFEDKGFFYKLYFDGVSNVLEVINIDNPNIREMNYNDYPIDACVTMIEKLHELKIM